jgi:hypothetical protein
VKTAWLIVAAAALMTTGCMTATRTARKPLTQEEIIQLSKNHMPDAELIRRMKETGTVYRLSAVEILHLHDAGVSQGVIDFILQDYVDAVRWQEREHLPAAWSYCGPSCYGRWPDQLRW